MIRNKNNPIITKEHVKPSQTFLKVDGVFNAGAAIYQGEVILLVRVAESVVTTEQNLIQVPVIKDGKVEIKSFDKNIETQYDYSDSRNVWQDHTRKKAVNLTSLSHIRRARSKDGIHFTIDEQPWIFPEGTYEVWGVEDPRITLIEEIYYITYSSVGEIGVTTSLITTTNFESFERKGPIFLPENKDVVIFPEKINGCYYALNRPVPSAIGSPDIWISKSQNLLYWGAHQHILGCALDTWENGRIGAGAVPFKTSEGYVEIYHGADQNNRYCLGALLLDLKNPSVLLKKSKEPLLAPEMAYEVEGFFGNVVFTCGAIYDEITNIVRIYYGCADESIALVEVSLGELLESME